MNKYFVRFEGTSGNLAIERYIYPYIRENYDNIIVSEDNIAYIIKDLEAVRDGYLCEHKQSKRVEVRQWEGYDNICYIGFGQLSLSLIKVKGEMI